ncbi:cytochrome c [Kiloniella laminariae]|uniref:Cytochrome c n=1 Tax=Kiloniella laminariae TaxID=454162 RepID=A0ABT4LGT9_9PROT|nr:cytochrome c [Kiloniella laminariae]MCZ4280315.1 cytochrome c [Kiloniella laminariae]
MHEVLRLIVAVGLIWAAAFPVHAADKAEETVEIDLLRLLHQDCGSCHGMTLKGGLGPALLSDSLAAYEDEDLFSIIRDGREETAMPPWRDILSDNQINELIGILRGKTAAADPGENK